MYDFQVRGCQKGEGVLSEGMSKGLNACLQLYRLPGVIG